MKNIIEKIRSSIKKHEKSIYHGDMFNTKKIINDWSYKCFADDNMEFCVCVDYEQILGEHMAYYDISVYRITDEFHNQAFFRVKIEKSIQTEEEISAVVEEVRPKKSVKYVSI